MLLDELDHQEAIFQLDCLLAYGRSGPILFCLAALRWGRQNLTTGADRDFKNLATIRRSLKNGNNLVQVWALAKEIHDFLPDGAVDTTLEAALKESDEIALNSTHRVLRNATMMGLPPPNRIPGKFDADFLKRWEYDRALVYKQTPCFVEAETVMKLYDDRQKSRRPTVVDLRTYKEVLWNGELNGALHIDCVNDPQWISHFDGLKMSEAQKKCAVVLVGVTEDDPIVRQVYLTARDHMYFDRVCVLRGGWPALHGFLLARMHPALHEHEQEKCTMCSGLISKAAMKAAQSSPKDNRVLYTDSGSNSRVQFCFERNKNNWRTKWHKKLRQTGALESPTQMPGPLHISMIDREDQSSDDVDATRQMQSAPKRRSFYLENPFQKTRPRSNSTGLWPAMLSMKGRSKSDLDGLNSKSGPDAPSLLPVGMVLSTGTISIDHYPRLPSHEHIRPYLLAVYLKWLARYEPDKMIATAERKASVVRAQCEHDLVLPAMCHMIMPILSPEVYAKDKRLRNYPAFAELYSDKLYQVPVWIAVTKKDTIMMVLRETMVQKDVERSMEGRPVYKSLELPEGDQKLLVLYDVPIRQIYKAYSIVRSKRSYLGIIRFVFKEGDTTSSSLLGATEVKLIPREQNSVWEVTTADESMRESLIQILSARLEDQYHARRNKEKANRREARSKLNNGFGIDNNKLTPESAKTSGAEITPDESASSECRVDLGSNLSIPSTSVHRSETTEESSSATRSSASSSSAGGTDRADWGLTAESCQNVDDDDRDNFIST